MSKRVDIVGRTYERLTVVSTPKRVGMTSRYTIRCRCSCNGNVKTYGRNDVVHGKSKSCGCLNLERIVERNTTHGWSGTHEYRCWFEMEARCRYANREVYKNYGKRGIRVHTSWRGPNGFITFLNDIGPAPSNRHQVDRIDNKKNYEPGNVRWATRKEQMRNRRYHRMLTAFGRTQCLAAWVEEFKIARGTLVARLRRMSLEEALTELVRTR